MHALKCLCEQQSTHISDWQPASGSVRCWCLACNCCFHHPSLGVQHPLQAQAASQRAPNNKKPSHDRCASDDQTSTTSRSKQTKVPGPSPGRRYQTVAHCVLGSCGCRSEARNEFTSWQRSRRVQASCTLHSDTTSQDYAPYIRGTSGLCTTEVPGQSHGQKPHHKATSLCTHPQANKPHASKHQEKPYEPLRANDR